MAVSTERPYVFKDLEERFLGGIHSLLGLPRDDRDRAV